MTSKERANLKSQAVKIEPVLQIGKSGVTPELTEAVRETFNTRELTKIHILQSCTEEGRVLAQTLADRTGAEVVQVIGRMIVLYKKNDDLHSEKMPAKEVQKSKAQLKSEKKITLKHIKSEKNDNKTKTKHVKSQRKAKI